MNIRDLRRYGLSRGPFVVLFFSLNAAFGYLAYSLVVHRLAPIYGAVELAITALLAICLAALFYLRLKDLRGPVIFALLPMPVVVNSWQLTYWLGYSDLSTFNLADLFWGLYLMTAIVLMFKKGNI